MIDQYWTVKMYTNAMLASFMAFASSIAADRPDVHSTVDPAFSTNSSRRPGSGRSGSQPLARSTLCILLDEILGSGIECIWFLFELVCDGRLDGVIRVRRDQQPADLGEHVDHLVGRLPFIAAEYREAHQTWRLVCDVRVVDAICERDLGGLERVLLWKLDLENIGAALDLLVSHRVTGQHG